MIKASQTSDISLENCRRLCASPWLASPSKNILYIYIIWHNKYYKIYIALQQVFTSSRMWFSTTLRNSCTEITSSTASMKVFTWARLLDREDFDHDVKTWSTQAFLNTFTFSRAALLSGMSANTWPIKLFCCYITHCMPHLYRVDELGFEIVKLFETDLHHPPALLVLRHSD